MATVVSRRALAPRRRIVQRRPRPEFEGSFFQGLAFALPVGLLVWLAIIWALREVV